MKTNLNFFVVWQYWCLLFFSCTKELATNDTSSPIISDNHNGREFITLKFGVVVEKLDDLYIFGGDIVLSDEQLKSLNEFGDIFLSEDNEPK